jgi:hypothetical protein
LWGRTYAAVSIVFCQRMMNVLKIHRSMYEIVRAITYGQSSPLGSDE